MYSCFQEGGMLNALKRVTLEGIRFIKNLEKDFLSI